MYEMVCLCVKPDQLIMMVIFFQDVLVSLKGRDWMTTRYYTNVKSTTPCCHKDDALITQLLATSPPIHLS
jgi:hypothetical protein